MSGTRKIAELTREVRRARAVVDSAMPLASGVSGGSMGMAEESELRLEAFRQVLAELLANQYDGEPLEYMVSGPEDEGLPRVEVNPDRRTVTGLVAVPDTQQPFIEELSYGSIVIAWSGNTEWDARMINRNGRAWLAVLWDHPRPNRHAVSG